MRIPVRLGRSMSADRSSGNQWVVAGVKEREVPTTDVKHYRAPRRKLLSICSPTRRIIGEKSSLPMDGSARRIGCRSGSVSLPTNWTTGLSYGSWTHESMTAPKTINE